MNIPPSFLFIHMHLLGKIEYTIYFLWEVPFSKTRSTRHHCCLEKHKLNRSSYRVFPNLYKKYWQPIAIYDLCMNSSTLRLWTSPPHKTAQRSASLSIRLVIPEANHFL